MCQNSTGRPVYNIDSRMVRGKLGVKCAVAEGKAVDNGSGGGNGTAFGICAAISFAEALFFALAPHSVGILAWLIAACIVNTCHVHRALISAQLYQNMLRTALAGGML